MFTAFLAALVLSSGTVTALVGTRRLASFGIGLKLLTMAGYRGKEGFLTPTLGVDMGDPTDTIGRFMLLLGLHFEEVLPFVSRNKKMLAWTVTAPNIQAGRAVLPLRDSIEELLTMGGEARSLGAALQPIVMAYYNVGPDDDKLFVTTVRSFRLLTPLLDFLEQIPHSRVTLPTR